MTKNTEKFKVYAKKIKLAEEKLSTVNLELALATNENIRLTEELKIKQSDDSEYQNIFKELVVVEDKFSQLLGEKRKCDEQLAEEKKLRLQLENERETEKVELRKSLEEELRMLKEFAVSKEEAIQRKYTRIIEDQSKEIESLKLGYSQSLQQLQYDRTMENLKEELSQARREISLLSSRVHQAKRDSQNTESPENCETISTSNEPCASRGSENSEAVHQPSSGTTEPPPLTSFLSSMTTELRSSQQKMTPLEVFKIPCKKPKSPLNRKRKLYCRSDDTL